MRKGWHRIRQCALSVWAPLLLLTLGSPSVAGSGHPQAATVFASAPERLSALLINGGGRRQINYYSHVDHLRRLTAMLDAAGVNPERIHIFSGDGADPAPDLATRDGHLPADFWLLPRGEASRLRPPIEYVNSEIAGFTLQPATRAALGAWFETDGHELPSGDTLLLYVTDHGEKDPDGQGNTSISLWGEELRVTELRELLARIHPGVRVVMLMSQCYSGGFANAIFQDDVETVPAGNVCGYFSAPPDRKAHGCYPEVSGREAVGHSHRMFEALAAAHPLPGAQREVLVTDGTPDVPNATTGFFLDRQLEVNAQRVDLETADFVDLLLAEALQKPLDWEPEIRLLDRVGQAFGFSSPRSLAQLEAQATGLSALRDQLDTYTKRWEAALDALRQENLAAFHIAHPELQDSVKASALASMESGVRSEVIAEYLEALATFTAGNSHRSARLRDLHWKEEEAKAARYRADVRVAAALRMRALLIQVAGRHFMRYHAGDKERNAFRRLERCEDLTLVGPEAAFAGSAEPAPFPTLEQERRQIEAITPGWLGLHYNAPQDREPRRRDLPSGAVVVSAVLPDSPAAAAQLQVTDIVLGPPGASFQERHELREWVMQSEIGRPLPMRVLREEQEIEVMLRLAPFPIELPKLPGPPQVGSVAPALELNYLSEPHPEPVTGQSQLLFFWATWCAPCKNSLPELLAFARDRNVEVVSITDEDSEVVNAFLHEFDGDFPEVVASDRRREQFQKYGVSGTPTFVLVDGGGVVRHYQAGYNVGTGLRIEGWQWNGGGHQ